MFRRKKLLSSMLTLLSLMLLLTLVSCDNSDSAEVEEKMEEMGESAEKVSEEMKKTLTAEDDKMEKMVFNVTDVDRQPIFGLECPVANNPVECSNEEILKFIKENAEFPKEAMIKDQDGFEQVIVVVEKDGTLSNIKYAASSKTKECEGCQKAAVDVVGKMNGWTPGMKDGKPVAVQMTIPVKFES